MRWTLFLLGASSLCAKSMLGAQETGAAIVTGRVTSESGAPLDGANVWIEQMALSVKPGADGRYAITIPAARVTGQSVTLRARAFGHTPEARTIILAAGGGAQTHDFVLRRDVNRLEEIV